MAVSSLKGCWSKFSARIRDYIDVVDSYYRPSDVDILNSPTHNTPGGGGGDIHDRQLQPQNHYHRNQIRYCEHNHKTSSPKASVKQDQQQQRTSNSTKSSHSHHNYHHNANSHQHHHHHHHHSHNHQHHHHRNNHQHQHDPNCVSYESAIRQLTNGGSIARTGTAPVAATAVGVTSSRTASSQVTPTATVTSSRLTSLGYTKRKTAQGQVYFTDLNGNKYWHDPNVPKELLNAQLDLDRLVGPLPKNWEARQTPAGKVYFVNHIKQTTQFTDPRYILHKDVLISHMNSEAAAPDANIKKDLHDKISILRQELLKQQVLSHPCRIDVNRKRIFEESFRAVSQMQSRDLKKRLLIKFRGEEGLDYGGVAREWFYLLSREILNPVHGLFQYTSDDNYNLQINPDSGIVYREHLAYMNFCGRIIGMAIFHGHFIEGRFSLPLYKMLLRKPITLGDIEMVDPELHKSLCWMLENDITDLLDTTFLVHHNAFGQLQEHELKPNGRNITVTEENKQEYVSLYVNYRCRRGIESQFAAIQRGFHELIQPGLVDNFDEQELELLIGGLTKINIEDWRVHTKLKNCTVDTPMIIWFWDVVKSYDEDKRARLLQFVTGSPRVPIQGFKALQGVNSELRLFTIHMIRNGNTDNLPKSHTCFNRIDMPPYETYDKLRDKLTQAIEETIGFAMQ